MIIYVSFICLNLYKFRAHIPPPSLPKVPFFCEISKIIYKIPKIENFDHFPLYFTKFRFIFLESSTDISDNKKQDAFKEILFDDADFK